MLNRVEDFPENIGGFKSESSIFDLVNGIRQNTIMQSELFSTVESSEKALSSSPMLPG